LDFAPQGILYSSSTNLNKSRRYLLWNLTGSVTLRHDSGYSAIDVEFTNKTFHANISFKDNFGVSIAALNEKGVILANQIEYTREDEYENELKGDEKKLSHIMFRPLNYQVEEKKEWIITLPKEEVYLFNNH
jgi:hypothetical protein